MKTVRAFLSVDIKDRPLVVHITHIQQQLDTTSASMKLVEPENLHFTWRFFGETAITKIDQMRQTLQNLVFSAFTIEVGGVSAFPSPSRPRVVWVGVKHNNDMMVRLKQQTDSLLARLGIPPEKRFVPHATIARIRRIHDSRALGENIGALRDVTVGTMTVDAITMKQSTLTPSGPIYKTLWEIRAR